MFTLCPTIFVDIFICLCIIISTLNSDHGQACRLYAYVWVHCAVHACHDIAMSADIQYGLCSWLFFRASPHKSTLFHMPSLDLFFCLCFDHFILWFGAKLYLPAVNCKKSISGVFSARAHFSLLLCRYWNRTLDAMAISKSPIFMGTLLTPMYCTHCTQCTFRLIHRDIASTCDM